MAAYNCIICQYKKNVYVNFGEGLFEMVRLLL